MSLVEIDAAGQVSVEILPFKPVRRARVLRGKHAELLLSDPSSDFIKAELTGDAPVIDGMKRLHDVFPLVFCDAWDFEPPHKESVAGESLRSKLRPLWHQPVGSAASAPPASPSDLSDKTGDVPKLSLAGPVGARRFPRLRFERRAQGRRSDRTAKTLIDG